MSQKIMKQSSILFNEISDLVNMVKKNVSVSVNSAITLVYWEIGHKINHDILNNERAGYGEEIVASLSQQLTAEFGSGYTKTALFRMMKFATLFDNREIVASLSQQLSWTHFIVLLPLKRDIEREFYGELCRSEGWSVRQLRQKIDSMLFERTAISRKSDSLIRSELLELREEKKISPELVFRSPYLLDFLGLKDSYSERSLEEAILREIERFILELGIGFTFVERQKRMIIDGEDYYLDLLFFHRKLKRLVAIDLKLGKFKAAYKGQMELYLRYLEKYELESGEDGPLGLILCSEGSREQIELLQLDKSGIRVAEYLTELPPKKLLKAKLRHYLNSEKERKEAK